MERLPALLRRLVVLQPGEAPALLASFATLLCMFASYTILRPVRDALGITSGLEKIPYLRDLGITAVELLPLAFRRTSDPAPRLSSPVLTRRARAPRGPTRSR